MLSHSEMNRRTLGDDVSTAETGRKKGTWSGKEGLHSISRLCIVCRVLGAQLSWGASRGVGLFRLAKFRAVGLLQKTPYLHAVTLESGATICIFRDP